MSRNGGDKMPHLADDIAAFIEQLTLDTIPADVVELSVVRTFGTTRGVN